MDLLRPAEFSTVIIDPRCERYGEAGRMVMGSLKETGWCLVNFLDGGSDTFNDGWITGVPQFSNVPRTQPERLLRLVAGLPAITRT